MLAASGRVKGRAPNPDPRRRYSIFCGAAASIGDAALQFSLSFSPAISRVTSSAPVAPCVWSRNTNSAARTA
jgi:hypothetical protein